MCEENRRETWGKTRVKYNAKEQYKGIMERYNTKKVFITLKAREKLEYIQILCVITVRSTDLITLNFT